MATKSKHFQAIFIVQLFLNYIITPIYASLVITVPAKNEECFSIRTPTTIDENDNKQAKRITISGNWDLLDDELGPEPLSVVLTDNAMKKEYYKSNFGDIEDTFEITTDAESGANTRYYFCIRNGIQKPYTDTLDRRIGLEIRVRSSKAGQSKGDNDMTEVQEKLQQHRDQLLDLSSGVTNKIFDLVSHQEYLRNRELQHREVVEQTFNRIITWTVLEGVTLLIVSIIQVVYLRKFFERRSYL